MDTLGRILLAGHIQAAATAFHLSIAEMDAWTLRLANAGITTIADLDRLACLYDWHDAAHVLDPLSKLDAIILKAILRKRREELFASHYSNKQWAKPSPSAPASPPASTQLPTGLFHYYPDPHNRITLAPPLSPNPEADTEAKLKTSKYILINNPFFVQADFKAPDTDPSLTFNFTAQLPKKQQEPVTTSSSDTSSTMSTSFATPTADTSAAMSEKPGLKTSYSATFVHKLKSKFKPESPGLSKKSSLKSTHSSQSERPSTPILTPSTPKEVPQDPTPIPTKRPLESSPEQPISWTGKFFFSGPKSSPASPRSTRVGGRSTPLRAASPPHKPAASSAVRPRFSFYHPSPQVERKRSESSEADTLLDEAPVIPPRPSQQTSPPVPPRPF